MTALFDPAPEAPAATVRVVADVLTPSKARNVFISSSRETECSVCLDAGPDTATMCCGGAYHFKCLAKWVAANAKQSAAESWTSSCPLCRHRIPCDGPAPVAAAAAAFVAPRRDAQWRAVEEFLPVAAPVAVAAAVPAPAQPRANVGNNARGDRHGQDVCLICRQVRGARVFSRNQWTRPPGHRKCIECIAGQAGPARFNNNNGH